jgi:hypothetical protein
LNKRRLILGWLGVAFTLIISSLWAYWGAFENFHEGWYSASFRENIFMFVFQYMLFAIIFTVLALIILKRRIIGLIVHILVGAFCIWFFSASTFNVLGLLIVIPFAVLGLIYFFGEPQPKKWAYRLIIFIPLLITLAISIPQFIKVSQRVDDGIYGAREVSGNGVTLIWAPEGPGWPDKGVSWYEAADICARLSEDGLTLMDTEQNIWRLPTADEAVRSMALHGINSGGVWDEEQKKAAYSKRPDKESPLWKLHSNIIYYWSGDTDRDNPDNAFMLVYNGGVYSRNKNNKLGYLSFRAVKDID